MISKFNLLFSLFFFIVLSVFSQNVPTTIQKKSILLEEFTGMYCGYCPDGHQIAKNLITANENAYVIAIHAGYLAVPGAGDPDFRIAGGTMLDNHFNGIGYPAGTINRNQFGNSYIMGRNDWIKNSKIIHAEDAPVNILLTSVFDGSTRKLAVNVRGYYTMEVQENSHWLNVVVIENNIIGPQTGGGMGSDYIHNKMLRHFITQMDEGVWGDEIVSPTMGEYFEFNYEIDLPVNVNGVQLKPEDIEVIAFVCKEKSVVLNVTGAKPSYINFAKPLKANLLKPSWEIGANYGFNYFEAQIHNQSHRILTSAKFDVTINGITQEAEWTGEIPPYQTKPILINVDTYTIKASNNYSIKLKSLNDQNFEGNSISGSFSGAMEMTETIKIEIKTDLFAEENRFIIKDISGNTVKEFGPYPSNLTKIYNESITLEKNKSYCFEVIDRWWDGISTPPGYIKLYNDDNILVYQANQIRTYGDRAFFHTSKNLPTEIQKKGILLEEFTGIYCGNCPDGHQYAKNLMYANENAYSIAIHAGHYAEPIGSHPDFRIPGGEIIDTEFNNYGYPSGLINRHLYDGNYILGRGSWIKSAKAVHSQDAPVNILLTSAFDGNTRKLSVKVEGYYTMEVDEEIHRLNVVIIENNIIAHQSGSDLGSNYVHNKMLRHFITQMDEEIWGDEIVAPKKGEYYVFDYEIDLPTDINGVQIKPEDIEIIAFICAEKTEVLNVKGSKPSYINFDKPLKANLLKPAKEISSRYGFNFFEAQLQNLSNIPVTSAKFEVTINGETQNINWTGEIPSFVTKPITIIVDTYEINTSNQYSVKLTELNGQSFESNAISGSFNGPLETTPTILTEIKTDMYADENRFLIKDRSGNIVKEFGTYETGLVATYYDTFTLEKNTTYCFEVIDQWWDGILDPRGLYKLRNDDNTLITQVYDIKLFGDKVFIHTSKESSAIECKKIKDETGAFYNDLKQTIEISFESVFTGIAEISLYSITGIMLENKYIPVEVGKKYELSLPASKYGKGIYLLKIKQNTENNIYKFLK